ncbi:MAG: tol-pal system YbgF family protein [Vulcanimicrobiota bacterium]
MFMRWISIRYGDIDKDKWQDRTCSRMLKLQSSKTTRIEVLFFCAERFKNLMSYGKAETCYREIFALYPAGATWRKGMLRLARLKLEEKKSSEAVALYEKILSRDPADSKTRGELKWFLHEIVRLYPSGNGLRSTE